MSGPKPGPHVQAAEEFIKANTREVRADLVPRLEATAAAYADAKEATALLLKQRDELIIEAADEGVSQRAIARAARFKAQSQVCAILANSQPDIGSEVA